MTVNSPADVWQTYFGDAFAENKPDSVFGWVWFLIFMPLLAATIAFYCCIVFPLWAFGCLIEVFDKIRYRE